MKLSRKEMKEALDTVPMDVVLLGSAGATGEKRLSPKEIEFARAIALGESKAGAYRKSRPNSKAKPENQSRRGQELMKKSAVQAQVEAFQRAIEAQRYQTPAHLRALVIHQLTEAALNPDFPPATRVNALKALGTVTEVAAFTERREVIKSTDSTEARERLLASLRMAMQSQAVDVDANDLLAELAPAPMRNAADADPATPTPQDCSDEEGIYMHSNLHNQSSDCNNFTDTQSLSCTNFTGGDLNFPDGSVTPDIEDTPPYEKGTPEK
jgi:hypothetical protein